MKGTITPSDVFYSHEQAKKLASLNNASDDGWVYEVVITTDKLARVLIKDEDGEEVGYL